MADTVKRVDYFHTEIRDAPGEAFRVLANLKEHGVTMLSCTAFPTRWNKAKLTMIPADSESFQRAINAARLPVSARKHALLIQGPDRPGAGAEILKKLSDAHVNVTAFNAGVTQGGTFTMALWVKAKDYETAAKALGA